MLGPVPVEASPKFHVSAYGDVPPDGEAVKVTPWPVCELVGVKLKPVTSTGGSETPVLKPTLVKSTFCSGNWKPSMPISTPASWQTVLDGMPQAAKSPWHWSATLAVSVYV